MPQDSVKHGFWHFSCIHARCWGHSGSDVHSGRGAEMTTFSCIICTPCNTKSKCLQKSSQNNNGTALQNFYELPFGMMYSDF